MSQDRQLGGAGDAREITWGELLAHLDALLRAHPDASFVEITGELDISFREAAAAAADLRRIYELKRLGILDPIPDGWRPD